MGLYKDGRKNEINGVPIADERLREAYADYLSVREAAGKFPDGSCESSLEELASVALGYLRKQGKLDKVEDMDGQGSYAVRINVSRGSENEPWLLMLNSSTGSAAGESFERAFLDSVCSRAYAYSSLRLCLAGDPLEQTLGLEPGKISHREASEFAIKEISDKAAGLEIPVQVADDVYRREFSDDRMEMIAMLSAAPAVNFRREDAEDSDIMLEAEVPELGRLRRLYRNGDAFRMIKSAAWKDEGTGGGNADGESSGADAFIVTLRAEHADMFRQAAEAAGLQFKIHGRDRAEDESGSSHGSVTGGEAAKGPLPMDLKESERGDRTAYTAYMGQARTDESSFAAAMKILAEDINICSRRGIAERMDSSAGSGTVMMPLGGRSQLTPVQAAVTKLPVQAIGDNSPAAGYETDDCTFLSWGCNPHIYEDSPYDGAYLSVIEAVSKLVASGASFHEIYLALQLGCSDNIGSSSQDASNADGRAHAEALLAAFEAEMGLGIPALSVRTGEFSKDTFAAFAFTTGKASEACSPEFKAAGHKVIILKPEYGKDGACADLPTAESLIALWRKAYELIVNGRAVAAYAPGMGGIGEAIMKMSYGNGIGFEYAESLRRDEIFEYSYGSIILELAHEETIRIRSANVAELGRTTESKRIKCGSEESEISELLMLYEGKLESVYPVNAPSRQGEIGNLGYAARSWHSPIFKRTKTKFLLPVMPGSIGETDIYGAVHRAGGNMEPLYIDGASYAESVELLASAIRKAQALVLPDLFEGYSILRKLLASDEVADAVMHMMDKSDGLILGIGGGFKLLLELGLLPYGRYFTDEERRDATGSEAPEKMQADGPNRNRLARAELCVNLLPVMRSRLARIRVASNKSPWLRSSRAGDIYLLPAASRESRFEAPIELLEKMAIGGQIATQYADANGMASSDIGCNLPGSVLAIEGLNSPDGRILGLSTHVERIGNDLYRNVPGNHGGDVFENAVRYFK